MEKLNDLLEVFKACSKTAAAFTDAHSINEKETVNSGFGKKTKRDRLIVMDDVSGLADECKKIVSFLTVARKFNNTCIHIFYTIYPEKTI